MRLTNEIAKMYEKAWERWGEFSQLTMINEECAEVIQAVCKLLRKKNDITFNRVVVEIADATIMFEQFLHMFDLQDEYFLIRQMKLERLKEKLKK